MGSRSRREGGNTAPSVAYPPGPRGPFFLWALPARKDPLGLLQKLVKEHGDVVFMRLAGRKVFLLNDPTLIRAVLVEHPEYYTRASVSEAVQRLVGGSLFLSEGADHDRRRRAAVAFFGHDRVEFVARVSADLTVKAAASWPRDAPFDLGKEIYDLGLRVIAANLFSMDKPAELERLSNSAMGAYGAFERVLRPSGRVLDRLPLRSTRHIERCSRDLIALADQLVRERRANPGKFEDLLSLFVEMRFSDGGPDRLTPQELRAEALDLLFGSHATIAALAWTLYELARRPEEQARLATATMSALGGRLPSLADIGSLQLARTAFMEGLRLHPTAWAFARRASVPVQLGEWQVPAGSLVVISPYVTQHDARNFPDPARFDMARWEGPALDARKRGTYFPFGVGPRSCLGEGIAMAQGAITLATILQALEIRTVPGDPAQDRAVGLQAIGRFPVTAHERPAAAA